MMLCTRATVVAALRPLAIVSLICAACQGDDSSGSDSFASSTTISPATTGDDTGGTSAGMFTTSGADCGEWAGDCIRRVDELPPCSVASDCCSPHDPEGCGESLGYPHNWMCVSGSCQHGGCVVDEDCGAPEFSCVALTEGGVRYCVHVCQAIDDCAILPGTACQGQSLAGPYCVPT